eukprot:PhM_4_TR504/c0_g1_i1/m.42190
MTLKRNCVPVSIVALSALIILLCGPGGADAAGGAAFSQVYSSGDIILENPIEGGSIMLFVIGVSAALEYLLDTAGEVRNKYFRVMFDALCEEITVVGLLSLLLSFSESILHNLPDRWLKIFNWAHMCLFFMAISLIIIIGILLVAVISQGRKWMDFEVTTLHQAEGRKNHFRGKENFFFLAHSKFYECLSLGGYKDEDVEKILFSDYLQKAERACLVRLTDLSWRSWLALTTLIIVNALRTKFIPIEGYDSDGNPILTQYERVVNLVTYISFCGYVPLVLFILVYRRLNLRLHQYLSYDPASQPGGGSAPTSLHELYDPRSFLFWQSTDATLTVIQVFILFFEWYFSVFAMSLLYTSLTKLDVVYRLFILLAFVPVIVFLYMVPWLLSVVAILSFLGSNLDSEIVEKILDSSKEYDDLGKHGDYMGREDSHHEGGMDEEHGAMHVGLLHGHQMHAEELLSPVSVHERKYVAEDTTTSLVGGSPASPPGGRIRPVAGITIDDSSMLNFARHVAHKRTAYDRRMERLEGKSRPALLFDDTIAAPSTGYFSDDPTSPQFERASPPTSFSAQRSAMRPLRYQPPGQQL